MTHASDQDLKSYLLRCPNEVLFDVTQILGDRLGFNGMKKRVPSLEGAHSATGGKTLSVDDDRYIIRIAGLARNLLDATRKS
jgi:hypothetical protein